VVSRILCKHCNVIHGTSRSCPVEARADAAECACIAVATSTFARWASRYLHSLASLAEAGVHVGVER
jgi:hypothetical protein